MKKANIFTLVGLFILLTFTACNKDQTVVKQLEGTWKVTSQTENGTAVAATNYQGITYTFQTCKVKDGDCNGSVTSTTSLGTFTLPFTYNISEKGEKFTMKFTVGSTTTTDTGTIQEHSKKKFVFETKDGSDVTVTTLEKQ